MATSLPTSYSTLPFKEIKLSHYPPSSPTPTPIIVLTLYRPGKHNAFTPTMMAELEQAFGLVDADDRVRCVVVTGDGKIFCAGADLEVGFVGGKERVNDHRDGGGRVVLAIHRCRKPVIGALQGSAVGVGITMTLPMAIRVAYKDAKVGFVFARRGLVMEACSSFFLPRLVGHSRALHLTTTGSVYRASDKLLDPLFTELCDRPDDVLPKALEIAKDVVENTSVVSTNLMKELMWRDTGSAEAQHLLDSRILYELFSSSDNKEGVQSFLEKRPPKFNGTMEKDAPGAYPWWNPIDTVGTPKVDQQSKSKL
ncbi:Enoyl- hydratase isomerase [Neofusicoccum parvum]|uniref:Enoyl- hydratase isomerase n=2 Tax=Neofusicoccum parvum TaxID=310453 RepID=A0ACB5RRT6_9PEZI|nr:putative enoyl- hydratase isomerase protein [Neofusicoccum parvum UCRNP2]GME23168.1 Enoyl- hydratase isomerase [Neofusicoccum parvum]GME37369.1 Enoyl- hydratase isomerase [Neofusicoccum parvum]